MGVVLSKTFINDEQTTLNFLFEFEICEQYSYLELVFRAQSHQKLDYLLHPYSELA